MEVDFPVVVLVDMPVDRLDVLVRERVSHSLESRAKFRSERIIKITGWNRHSQLTWWCNHLHPRPIPQKLPSRTTKVDWHERLQGTLQFVKLFLCRNFAVGSDQPSKSMFPSRSLSAAWNMASSSSSVGDWPIFCITARSSSWMKLWLDSRWEQLVTNPLDESVPVQVELSEDALQVILSDLSSVPLQCGICYSRVSIHIRFVCSKEYQTTRLLVAEVCFLNFFGSHTLRNREPKKEDRRQGLVQFAFRNTQKSVFQEFQELTSSGNFQDDVSQKYPFSFFCFLFLFQNSTLVTNWKFKCNTMQLEFCSV